MIKTVLIVSCLVFLGACSTTPQSNINEPRKAVLDDDCAALAKYVRGIALSRDVGISASDAKTIARGQHAFPVDPVIRDVYKRKDLDPVSSATNSYGVCVNMGYKKIVQLLTEAELAEQLTKSEEITDMVRKIDSAFPSKPVELKLDATLSKPPSKKPAKKAKK